MKALSLPGRRQLGAALDFARRETLAVAAGLGVLLLTLSFFEIADDMAEGDTEAIDLRILMLFRADDTHEPIGPAWLDQAAADITALGSLPVVMLFAGALAGLFVAIGKHGRALAVVVATAGAVAWSQALKAVFDRPRPDQAFHAVEVINASFPSGHALISASVYLTLGVLTAGFSHKRRIRAFALGMGVLLTALVGVTRVFLGVHFPSDVLAGWCLGAAWALFCWLTLWAWTRPGRGRDLQRPHQSP